MGKSERSKSPAVESIMAPARLMKIIRGLATDTSKVAFGKHARERLGERGISNIDAIRVLRIGEISGSVVSGARQGEWKCKVTAPIKGGREVGVITITYLESTLFIKTVEWED